MPKKAISKHGLWQIFLSFKSGLMLMFQTCFDVNILVTFLAQHLFGYFFQKWAIFPNHMVTLVASCMTNMKMFPVDAQ